MRAIDIYNREAQEITRQLGYLKNHISEIEESELWGISEDKNTRVEIRTHKYFNFDGRRYWKLASVWYDNMPVMIIQNAGREGEDHEKKFITNKKLYIEMVKYIITLKDMDDYWIDECCININQDIQALDSFYGNKLDGEFKTY